MKRIEYGEEHKDAIILLHGGGLSWWSYREAAEILKARYRVVIPILDGHAGSSHGFTTIEENAQRVIALIEQEYGGHVFAIGGLSLGAQILVQILAMRPYICDKAVIESASVLPSKLTSSLISPMLNMSYPLIKRRWFSRLQFKELRINEALFDAYYEDSIRIQKADMIAFLKASTAFALPKELERTISEVTIIVGEMEQKKLLDSARLLKECIPNSVLSIKEKLYHGEYSINYPELYSKEF